MNNDSGPSLAAAADATAAGDFRRAAALYDRAGAAAEIARTPLATAVCFQAARAHLEIASLDAAERWIRLGLRRKPGDFALNNLLGVVLRRAGRFGEALDALDVAARAAPHNLSPLINRGNVLLELADGPRAVEVYRRLVRAQPQRAEHLRLLGRAYRLCGDAAQALKQFELARRLESGNGLAWVDAADVLRDLGRCDDAIELLTRGLAHAQDKRALRLRRASTLRRVGRQADAIAQLQAIVTEDPGDADARFELGRVLFPRAAGNEQVREAVRLRPNDPAMLTALAFQLDRTRDPAEGANIAEAYKLAKRVLELPGSKLHLASTLVSILARCADYGAAAQLGSFEQLGQYWGNTGRVSALLHMLSRVKTPEQRRLLVGYHRAWGQKVEQLAAASPLRRSSRPADDRIRVGIMSSDLYDHPVSYFALPLIEGIDRRRFAVHCYSWSNREEDHVQRHIASRVDAFRWHPDLAAREAAQLIADDHLDILFELGGATDMNRLEAMAWRPAPVQVSWLGYPHSAGLKTIDRILVDPYVKPADPELLIERPFELEHSWVSLGTLGFSDRHVIEPGTPEDRSGVITFGTMNNPYKYHPALLATWAEVLAQAPGSRFLFVRPEGAVAAFRDNVRAVFAAGGVAPERIDFVAVRGAHMRHYNAIDIALDCFPQTGGTTTCESLWMGVPVVTLAGEAFFERLSHSNLNNAGLGDLSTTTREAYVAKALALAADKARRRHLRAHLRTQIRAHPLGQTERFVAEFERAIERTLNESR